MVLDYPRIHRMWPDTTSITFLTRGDSEQRMMAWLASSRHWQSGVESMRMLLSPCVGIIEGSKRATERDKFMRMQPKLRTNNRVQFCPNTLIRGVPSCKLGPSQHSLYGHPDGVTAVIPALLEEVTLSLIGRMSLGSQEGPRADSHSQAEGHQMPQSPQQKQIMRREVMPQREQPSRSLTKDGRVLSYCRDPRCLRGVDSYQDAFVNGDLPEEEVDELNEYAEITSTQRR
ncbi:uncharacterized protein BDR25DRAFT_311542 [Lindgomyces ingoldianus]|uniref:Uncharacterized protein n=1 Tax=Lindgomyces ingoldianus TaxID=673940 RepID=A0ACB6R6S8_9PLEO|nr:uncharacterized protein BDR25DRAFT_311542 [Lindgomyces ingoldianus]KAF2474156.1 hypothetical protein BDR25DRAFT_311542 [Lindgomyces ingoldianus]